MQHILKDFLVLNFSSVSCIKTYFFTLQFSSGFQKILHKFHALFENLQIHF